MNSRLQCKHSDSGFLEDDSPGPGKRSNSLLSVSRITQKEKERNETARKEILSSTNGSQSHVLCVEMGALPVGSRQANDCQLFSGMIGACVQHRHAVDASVALYGAGCCTDYC